MGKFFLINSIARQFSHCKKEKTLDRDGRSFRDPAGDTFSEQAGDVHITDLIMKFGSRRIYLDIIRGMTGVKFPVRFLCDEDCKGLCPKCGKDLNEGECSCVTKEVDPRLEPLRKLLEQIKNEENK